MKNLKKVLSVVITIVMMSVMMLGCGGPKTTLEESTKIALDVILKADKSQIDKIGMSEEEYNDVRNSMEESMVKQFAGTSFNLSEDEQNTLKDNVLEGISKISYEVGEANIEKDTANVTVKIKGINVTELTKQAQNKLMEKVNADPALAQDQDKLIKESINVTGELFKEAPLTDDSRDVEFTLTKQDNCWTVSDASFGDLLTALYRF